MTPVAFKNTLTTLGWSQRELAQRLGVSHNTINRYTTGDRKIPADVALWLERLARCVLSDPPPKR